LTELEDKIVSVLVDNKNEKEDEYGKSCSYYFSAPGVVRA
jgi:hypothetical protein